MMRRSRAARKVPAKVSPLRGCRAPSRLQILRRIWRRERVRGQLQLARAIREGIGHDGRALFPIMPYSHFRSMSDEDVASVVVFLRSLRPVHKTTVICQGKTDSPRSR